MRQSFVDVSVKPELPKILSLQCLDCVNAAEVLYKGTSYCKRCATEYRRTHNA